MNNSKNQQQVEKSNMHKEANVHKEVRARLFGLAMIVLGIAAMLTILPTGKTVNIYEEGINTLKANTTGQFFLLEPHSYQVLNNFDSETLTVESNDLTTEKFEYFNVLVTDKLGEQCIIAVRTSEKVSQLKYNSKPQIYGMMSTLKDELKNNQLKGISTETIKVFNKCINDNGDKVTKYGINTSHVEVTIIGLIIVTTSTIFLIKSNKNRKETKE